MEKYHTIVIGAGAGGLVVAIGLAKAGKNVALIEGHKIGGDCTNYGCIPSKSLVSCAKAASFIRNSKKKGIEVNTSMNCDGALQYVRDVVSAIRKEESVDYLSNHGVAYINGQAQFSSSTTLTVGNRVLCAKKIVIATGSQPFIPSINGLGSTPFLTNETIFSKTSVPSTLAIIGTGPIGLELGQSFQRLGSCVSFYSKSGVLLRKENESVSAFMKNTLEKEGCKFIHGIPSKIKHSNDLFSIETNGKISQYDDLLIATGRRPRIDSLCLENANIQTSKDGIVVNRYLQTNHSHIFAIGDCNGISQFTHMAEAQGRAVVESILFLRKRFSLQNSPKVTFTDPEVASIGPPLRDITKRYNSSRIATYTLPLSAIDRGKTTKSDGFIEITTKKFSSKILSATIVAPRAGDMMMELSLAIYKNIPLRSLRSLIHPYPIWNRGIRKIADMWYSNVFIATIKKVLRL